MRCIVHVYIFLLNKSHTTIHALDKLFEEARATKLQKNKDRYLFLGARKIYFTIPPIDIFELLGCTLENE